MTFNGWLQIAIFAVIVTLLVRPVGRFMVRVFEGEKNVLSPVLRPVEAGFYKLAGVDPTKEQSWITYAVGMLIFKLLCFFAVYAVMRLQYYLPWNPEGQTATTPDLSLNTAISFVTNTNWQNYGGESTISYFVQMVGLTVQNFTSAAAGIAIAVAMVRGFSRRSAKTLGNYWVDLTRATLYLLLPVCILLSLFYIWQGVPQTLGGYVDAVGLEGVKQSIAVGPVASQEAIKILGTNGGGFFNANSAHPFENPTGLSNLIQMLCIFAIGAGLTNMFGRMVKDERQGWAIFGVMALMFLVGAGVLYNAEAHANPVLTALGVDPSMGNMEGKEIRFGIANSALFATATTDTSCGAVNSMHDSFMPIGGMVPMINMMLGEVIFGGVGSGLYGMLLFVIVAVFVAGLMVGRTPEYLGKKIEAKEVKMTMLAVLVLPLMMLGLTAIAVVLPGPLAALNNAGPHGFSEALYAYTSGAANNGSAFAGLSGNTPYWNDTLALDMLIGRFFVMIPALAIAGSLAAKKTVPASAGTFPTHGGLFIGLVTGVVVIIGGLTFFPALALGPIVEHYALNAGTLF